jgi:hypothetical protein
VVRPGLAPPPPALGGLRSPPLRILAPVTSGAARRGTVLARQLPAREHEAPGPTPVPITRPRQPSGQPRPWRQSPCDNDGWRQCRPWARPRSALVVSLEFRRVDVFDVPFRQRLIVLFGRRRVSGLRSRSPRRCGSSS